MPSKKWLTARIFASSGIPAAARMYPGWAGPNFRKKVLRRDQSRKSIWLRLKRKRG